MIAAAGLPPIARYVAIETAIGVVVNMVLGALFTLLLFFGGEPALWGIGGLAFDFVPSTFLPVAAMTAGMTIVTRKRRRFGKAPALRGGALPLPAHLLARSLLFAAGATVVIGSAGLALLLLVWSPELPFRALLGFKLGYAFAVALVMAPLIVVAALRDPTNLPPEASR